MCEMVRRKEGEGEKQGSQRKDSVSVFLRAIQRKNETTGNVGKFYIDCCFITVGTRCWLGPVRWCRSDYGLFIGGEPLLQPLCFCLLMCDSTVFFPL